MNFPRAGGRVLALLGVLAAASLLRADTIPFSGSGLSGALNPNPLQFNVIEDDTTVRSNFRGISTFGVPGLGFGLDSWPSGVGSATSFTITFSNLPEGVTIDETPDPNGMSFDDYTRFHDYSISSPFYTWTPSYSGGDSVTFTAGTPMSPGDTFLVDIAFTGGEVTDAIGFTGYWTVTSVPEPDSMSLTIGGLFSAALIARRRNRQL